jgi:hypothetical protein
LNPQPAGAQISLGSLVQPVTGEYFFTAFCTTFLTLSQLLQLGLYLFPTSLNPQPAGAQISLGSLVQPVTGEYFFTAFFTTLHSFLGQGKANFKKTDHVK